MGHEPFPVHVADVELPFRCVDAGAVPGVAATAEFARSWPAYRRWYLHEGERSRPSYAACRDAVRTHLPELAADYSAFVDAVGGGDLEARFLSHWCPPPLVAACSIAMLGAPAPVLLRNYDYPPMLCDALALRTHWSGRSIIGMSDCGWGLMDGVNDAGLAVSISFGGRREVGDGFGIGLIVRALLQSAATTVEAVDRLVRIPVQMSYNVAIVDAIGDRRVVHIAPDRPARISYDVTVANRQGQTEWPEHAEYCNTVEREQRLVELAEALTVSAQDLEGAFLTPPLFRPLIDSTWGTVYTVAYEPLSGAMTLLWPDDRWDLSVHAFDEGLRPRHVRALVPEPVHVRTEVPRQEGTLFLL
jgi:predicted choloylglycine hydrolase